MIQVRLCLVALLGWSSLCLADASDYDYVQAGYVTSDNDVAANIDFAGFGVKGSFQFFDNFYASARYIDVSEDDDIPGVSASGDQLNVGIGYIFGVNETASIYTEVMYVDVSASASGGGLSATISEDGFGVGAGVRLNTGPRSEFHLGGVLEDVGTESDTSLVAELLYDFFPSKKETGGVDISGVIGVQGTSGNRAIYFGARVSF